MKRPRHLKKFLIVAVAIFIIGILLKVGVLPKEDASRLTAFSQPARISGREESVPLLPTSLIRNSVYFSEIELERRPVVKETAEILILTAFNFSNGIFREIRPLESGEYKVFSLRSALPPGEKRMFFGETSLDLIDLKEDAFGDRNWAFLGDVDLKRWQEEIAVKPLLIDNLIKNPSFEEGLCVEGRWECSGGVTLSAEATEGTHSAELSAKYKGVSISQELSDVEKEHRYTFSFSYRHLSGEAPPVFSITQILSDGEKREQMIYLEKEPSWQDYDFYFDTYKDTESLRITFDSGASNNSKTTNLYDNVKLWDADRHILIFTKDLKEESESTELETLSSFPVKIFKVGELEGPLFLILNKPYSRFWQMLRLNPPQLVSDGFHLKSINNENVWYLKVKNSDHLVVFNLIPIFLIILFLIFVGVGFFFPMDVLRKSSRLLTVIRLKAGNLYDRFNHLIIAERDNFHRFFFFEILLIILFLTQFFYPIFSPKKLTVATLLLFVFLVNVSEKIYLVIAFLSLFFGFLSLFLFALPEAILVFFSTAKLTEFSDAMIYLGLFFSALAFYRIALKGK